MVVALVIVVLLSAAAYTLTGTTATSSGGGAQDAQVARADDVEAQASLSTALTNAKQAATTAGGVASIDLSQLGIAEGPSTSPTDVSGAVASAGGDVPGGILAAGAGGSVTLAARSASGTCWLVWASASSTWYGAQQHAPSCAATASAGPPTSGAGAVWQSGSFPPG